MIFSGTGAAIGCGFGAGGTTGSGFGAGGGVTGVTGGRAGIGSGVGMASKPLMIFSGSGVGTGAGVGVATGCETEADDTGIVPPFLSCSATATSTALKAVSRRSMAGRIPPTPQLRRFIASRSAFMYSRPTSLLISTKLTGLPTLLLTADLISRIRFRYSTFSTGAAAAGAGAAGMTGAAFGTSVAGCGAGADTGAGVAGAIGAD